MNDSAPQDTTPADVGHEHGSEPGPVVSKRIYQNADYILHYQGPDPDHVDRFVITFPDLIHPTGPEAPGWGTAFLLKRGAAVISLTFEKANWYQSPGFFPAIDAARDFVDGRAPISAYGASMGGYGAILAGNRLGADRVVALCPQFTIEQDIAPFEHRYRAEAAEIGPFMHDVSGEMSDDIPYFIMHDPTHNIDRKHAGLFPKPARWHSMVQPGSSHGVLDTLIQAGGTDALFRLIMGHGDHHDLRQTFRAGRRNSARYIRRMGNLSTASPRRTKLAQMMIGEANKVGMKKFATRWRRSLAERYPAAYSGYECPLEEVVLHIGLPKTGSTSVQMHLAANRQVYRQQGLAYASDLADDGAYPPNHRWLSMALLSGDLSRLQMLRDTEVYSPRLLLSDENLFVEMPYIRRVAFKQFRAQFSDVPLRILTCTRDKLAWKKSFYKQAIEMRGRPRSRSAAEHWGHSDSFATFFRRPVIAKLSDWDQMFDEAQHRFGAEVVEQVPMQPDRDIVTDFLGHAGLNPVNLSDQPRSNLSLTDLDAEILRQANAQGPGHHGMMRILLGLPTRSDTPPQIKPRFLNKIRSNAVDFNWAALRYRENPPLVYTRDAFKDRKASLKKLATDLRVLSEERYLSRAELRPSPVK